MHHMRASFISILIASLTLVLPSYSMNLDTLPRDVVGNIIVQLVKNVGTPTLINEAEILVVVKNIKALSLVNRSLYRLSNNSITSRMFVQALAQRFGISPLNAVVKINTPGARKWLTEHLEETGEYETFKVMQRVLEIADELQEEFKSFGFTIQNSQRVKPGTFSAFNQTKQGLFLSHGGIWSTPHSLFTPWGAVQLFCNGQGDDLAFPAFTQAFFKRFRTSFSKFCKSGSSRGLRYRVLATALEATPLTELLRSGIKVKKLEEITKELTAEEVKARVGVEGLIFSNSPDSIYQLTEIDGRLLPCPEMQDRKKYRDYKIIKLIFEVLQAKYDKENRVLKVPHIDNAQGETALLAHKSASPKTYFTSIESASEVCVMLLRQLDAQPLCNGDGTSPESTKNSAFRKL